MRILMISDVYFPRINGVSTSIQTFKEELEKAGHQVYLVVPEYPLAITEELNIIRFKSRKVPFDHEDRMMDYGAILKHMDTFRAWRPDIVHIQTPFVAHYAGLRIAKALDLPCVTTYHTLFEEYLYHYIPWLPKQLLRFGARRFSRSQCNQVSGVIVPSSIIEDLLLAYGVNRDIRVLPTGINAAAFACGNGARFRDKLGIAANKKIVLNVSRVAYEKNIGLLLDMFAMLHASLPDTQLVIAGEGPARNTYIARAKELNLEDSISFVGYLNRETDLVDCYHAADVFVFASKTETQGLVLLEAMAAGLPVVSIAAMGTRDVLKEGKGASITDGTLPDFSRKVAAVLQYDSVRDLLSQSAVEYANTWSSQHLTVDMLAFYEDIIANEIAQAESLA